MLPNRVSNVLVGIKADGRIELLVHHLSINKQVKNIQECEWTQIRTNSMKCWINNDSQNAKGMMIRRDNSENESSNDDV